MERWLTTIVVAVVALTGSAASAQEFVGVGPWEVTGFPGGGIVFTEGTDDADEPDFSNYALGGSLTHNFNRYWGVEGELGWAIGHDQRLQFGDGPSPDMLAYHGNALFYPWANDRRLIPYVTGGVGGLSVFQEERVGFNDDETFLTGNVGGGVKFSFGRWGLRGDYRLFAVDAKEDAPLFFGSAETRYGHRLYGGFTFGFGL